MKICKNIRVFYVHEIKSLFNSTNTTKQSSKSYTDFLLRHEKALLSFSKRGRRGLVEARLRTAS